MKHLHIFVLLSACLIASWCSSHIPKPVTPSTQISTWTRGDAWDINNTANQEADKIENKQEITPDSIEEVTPYSTQALIAHEFSGYALRLEAIELANTTYTRYRISYMSNDLRISWILNIPTWAWPFPLIILNHGYIDPAVYTVGRGLKREQDYLARAWFAVLHTDYRNHGFSDKDPLLNQTYMFRNYFYTQDSINAILSVQESTLKELSSIDSTRVWMLGHSMWWWVTMHALIAKPGLIDAAVLYAPVHASEWYNFDRWRREDLSPNELKKLETDIWSLDEAWFMPYSATPYLDRVQAPLQIYFWTQDISVPYDRWVDIQTLLQEAWKTSELITYPGEKHEFISQWNTFMRWTLDFFSKEL